MVTSIYKGCAISFMKKLNTSVHLLNHATDTCKRPVNDLNTAYSMPICKPLISFMIAHLCISLHTLSTYNNWTLHNSVHISAQINNRAIVACPDFVHCGILSRCTTHWYHSLNAMCCHILSQMKNRAKDLRNRCTMISTGYTKALRWHSSSNRYLRKTRL